ncbi:MAG: ATP-binding cassette domain-containing protein, partial [Acidilobaceae archaeon]
MAKGVVIKNLWKIFPPRVAALRDINVEIAPGEFYVILGPSGSGKTTLLRILAGLEIPTKGSVIIGDKEVVNTEKGVFVEPQDRNIGMVFQNWALYPHMTVYENIAFPLELKGVPRRERDERVRDVAEVGVAADVSRGDERRRSEVAALEMQLAARNRRGNARVGGGGDDVGRDQRFQKLKHAGHRLLARGNVREEGRRTGRDRKEAEQ